MIITGKQFRNYWFPCLLIMTSTSIMTKHCFKIKIPPLIKIQKQHQQ